MAKYKSDINLFDCIFKDKTKKTINLEKELKKYALVFAVVAVGSGVIGGLAVGAQKAMLEVTKADTAKLKSEHDFDKIAQRKVEMEQLQADNQKIRDELAKFQTSVQFKSELFGYIAAAQPEDIVINSISYDKDTITLDCTGREQLTLAKFSARLRDEKEKISDVDYSGVSNNDETWSGKVTVTLRDLAAEEEAKAKAEAAKAEAAAAAAAEGESTTGEA